MESKDLALLCAELAENKKAKDIVILDLRKLSSITDFFVIATGNSDPHLRAIVEEITSGIRRNLRLSPRATDGFRSTAWVVLDYFEIIAHVMSKEVREFYDLEGLWGDAPRIELPMPASFTELP